MNEREREKERIKYSKEWLFVPNCDKFISPKLQLDCKKKPIKYICVFFNDNNNNNREKKSENNKKKAKIFSTN